MNRVLVVRLGSLGDLVHTLPAVASIRRALADIEIDWLVDAVHEEFLSFVPAVTSVVRLDAPTPAGWMRAVRQLRARRYDAALDFQGLLKSAALSRLSGATRVIGFDRRSLREAAAAPFYQERVVIPPGLHVIEKNLRLAAAIAGPRTGVLEFPIDTPRSSALDSVRSAAPEGFVLINPGAAWPNKRWPPERFGRLARWIHDHHGWRSIVLWGPGERELAEGVVRHSGGIAVEAPPTRLADVIALGRAARLMVSGDTGPTHIAAAVGTPIVALFGPTDPDRNGPWRPDDEVVTRYDRCDCHYERRCRRVPDRWCLGTISDDDLRQAVSRRLSRHP